MSIRSKLIMMLAIPLAALAFVGALGFRAQSSAANEASNALAADNVVQDINRAIKAVGAERLAIVADLETVELDQIRAITDTSLATAGQTAAAANLPGVQAAITNATANLVGARSEASVVDRVTEMNDAADELRTVRRRIEVDYPSPDSFAEATSIDMAVDIADRQDAIWLEYIASDTVTPDLAERLAAEVVATELLRQQILDIAPESHIAPLNESLASEADAGVERAAIEALDRFDRGEAPLADAPTLEAVIASHEDWYGHAVMLQDDVSANLAQRATDAESRQNLFALLGTLGLLVLFGLIYVVYRSVVRPLNDLLEGAEQVALHKLPSVVSELRLIGSSDADVVLDPLPRQTDDELGSLVDAFNDVQLTAFDLAVEQARSRRNIAEMFVNLGRRNQKLLQRMLNVLSDLEQDEKDGDKLERLFELDHMTTRMRRNAESLLVVAGTKTPRQWAKPVPAADVVRSALAEVQEYQRVDVMEIAEAPMAGNAVTDVTHLLAELLENSLQFSEPDSRVTVAARWHEAGYRIVVSDLGFGMSDEELAEHNNLIANPPAPDQAPTRFLGLFVVGHLAARHGIEVVLSDGTVAGTDARITIPTTVMSDVADPSKARVAIDAGDSGLDAHLASDIDFDAELSKLTAEAAAEAEANENAAGFGLDALPRRGQPADEINLTDLPTRNVAPVEKLPAPVDFDATPEPSAFGDRTGEAVADDATPEPSATSEVPVVAAHVTELVDDQADTPADHSESMWIDPSEMLLPAPEPTSAPAPFSTAADVETNHDGEAPAIDFSQLPEPPTFAPAMSEAMPAPAVGSSPSAIAASTPVATAQAPAAPAAATAPVPSPTAPSPSAPSPTAPSPSAPSATAPAALTGDAGLGLPTRRPRAALEELGSLVDSVAPSPAAATSAPDDVAASASTIGSQFSAFQAATKRSDDSRG